MTDDIEIRIQAVRQQVAEARKEAARREAQADQARAVHAQALTELRSLGHDTAESALAEIALRRSQVASIVTELELLLSDKEITQ